jgi:catechol 2,3-dioxygenase-like lactoylglutathione lyase family enzyme
MRPLMTSHFSRRPLVTALGSALVLSCLVMTPSAQSGGGSEQIPSVRPLVSQASMNVYRRFAPEHREKMLQYYGQVVALRSLSPINLGGGSQMILFGVGTGQVKLASGLKQGREYHHGAVNDATGIRVITLFFPDEAALTARFAEFGYPKPQFRDGRNGARVAMVTDPGGFTTELVVVPNAPAATFGTMEVGINVSNLEKSRAFYRDFVGLDELPPVKDAVLGVTKYPYRHGETTISLWQVGSNLPADTGSAGIQYVVSDVDTVDARAKARNVTVEEPLSNLSGFSLRTVWLNDPDGVTNYFAQVGARRANTTQ